MSVDERDEKLGRAVVTIGWFIFAAKFITVVSVIALVILYILGKTLWLAPVIGIGVFAGYRLIWRLIRKFIGWSANQ